MRDKRKQAPGAEEAAAMQGRKIQPGTKSDEAQGVRADRNALKDPTKQQENRERMGVGPDHKTDSMKKGDRGTFP